MDCAALGTRLAHLLSARPGETPAPRALVATRAPHRVTAIDGSSVALAEPGGHLLAAYRAATVRIEGPRSRADADEVEVVLLAPGETRPEAELDARRTRAELRAAERAIHDLAPGDLLLLDGPLQERPHVPSMDALLAQARGRGVDVVGVCKSTSLLLGGAPALAACLAAGREAGLATWSAPLARPANVRADVLAAKLSSAEPRAFRFDVSASDGDAHRVLAGVAALCGHPAYPGYPSPLAMAHNAALLDEGARSRLLAEVEDAALRAGVRPADWEAACVDYHDVLELGA